MQVASVLAAPCIVGNDGNRDGMPTVLLEAMALGAPCVATAVTGIPEIVIDGRTGLIIPQRDPPALAAAIRRLLNEPSLCARLAERARTLIERQFDIDRNAMTMRRVFREAIRRGNEARANDRVEANAESCREQTAAVCGEVA
jgi:glycosyltransferase involved in cell wall biosynthesis